jgi:hypothetical protein
MKTTIVLFSFFVLFSCKENKTKPLKIDSEITISKPQLTDTIGDCSNNKDIIEALSIPKKIGKYNFLSAMCFPERGIVISFSVPNKTKDHALMISIFDTNSKEYIWKLKDFKDGFLEAQKPINKGHKIVLGATENFAYTVVNLVDNSIVANYYTIINGRYVFSIQADQDQDLITNTQMEVFANQYLSKIDVAKLNK